MSDDDPEAVEFKFGDPPEPLPHIEAVRVAVHSGDRRERLEFRQKVE